MQLIEVNDKKGVALFHQVSRELYRDDPHYVAPLKMEIEEIFDAKKNGLLLHGAAIRWVLCDKDGGLIGRIAAFVDLEKANKNSPIAGGVGFFVCIDDQDAASTLFQAAQDWLTQLNCEAMDGSINFGENFVNWGVLVHGFMQQGYGMPYNKPYYGKLFEGFGFNDYFQQLSYHVDLTKPFPARMEKFAEYLETRPGYSFAHFSKRNQKKFLLDFVNILNQTWSDYMEGYTPIKESDIQAIFDSAKAILQDDFVWFAYKDDKPVGLVVAFPDVNQILSHFNGKLNFWETLKFLYLKKKKTITRNRVLLAGVIPEFQNSGVVAALFLQFARAMRNRPEYKEMELSWVGDYNPRMHKIYEQIGGVHMKTHVTYRFLFDPSASFERFTNEKGNSGLRKDVREKQ
ncbi:MAG: GNAT family N-acetyltransferase [Bacteroidales bacterium]|nr:GNAT family N-acetyltransferase [Bacteroidales bacterium]